MVEFAILGPLEARSDGEPIARLGGPKQRALLAVLLLDAGSRSCGRHSART